MRSAILQKFIDETKNIEPYSMSAYGFEKNLCKSIKRQAKRWPERSLGKIAAKNIKPITNDEQFPLSFAWDAYYIREALLGKHYRQGIYRVEEKNE